MNVGDLILGVSQNPDEEPVDISIMKLSDAVDLIKGEKGTKVSIKRLFFATPARLKFLKSKGMGWLKRCLLHL